MFEAILKYIATCTDERLYSIFSKSIEEMNRRKTAEIKKLQENNSNVEGIGILPKGAIAFQGSYSASREKE